MKMVCGGIFVLLLVLPGWAFARTVTLAWTDNANNEAGFGIFHQVDGGPFQSIAQVGVDATGHSLDIAPDDLTHCFYVVAFNTAGESAPSNTACILQAVNPPAAPTDLTVN